MLLRFRFSNHRSFLDEQEFSLVAGSGGEHRARVREPLGPDQIGVLPVAAIYGANAAGKSNVQSAMAFMRSAVLNSHRAWPPKGGVPREPFLLDGVGVERTSLFEVDFVAGGTRCQYGFEVDSETVVTEWLHAYPHGRRRVLFDRGREGVGSMRFSSHLKGPNKTLLELMRPNSLFLSVAAENNHVALETVHGWFDSHIGFVDEEGRLARLRSSAGLLNDAAHRELIAQLLTNADVGIVDAECEDTLPHGRHLEVLKTVHELLEPEGKTFEANSYSFPRVSFKHRGPEGHTALLPIEKESRGTATYFALLGPLLGALAGGDTLFLDELGASIHPHLAAKIVALFHDPIKNPNGAQLVYNTHNTSLLGKSLEGATLRRDQIWFVEKDDAGRSHMYPLTDFHPRKSESIERGYIQGRYGAVPFVDSLGVLSHIVGGEDEDGPASE